MKIKSKINSKYLFTIFLLFIGLIIVRNILPVEKVRANAIVGCVLHPTNGTCVRNTTICSGTCELNSAGNDCDCNISPSSCNPCYFGTDSFGHTYNQSVACGESETMDCNDDWNAVICTDQQKLVLECDQNGAGSASCVNDANCSGGGGGGGGGSGTCACGKGCSSGNDSECYAGQTGSCAAGTWSCVNNVCQNTTVCVNPTATTAPGSPTATTAPLPTLTPACITKTSGDADCNGTINEFDFKIWQCELLGNGTCSTNPDTANITTLTFPSNKASSFDLNQKVDLIDFEILRNTLYAIPISMGQGFGGGTTPAVTSAVVTSAVTPKPTRATKPPVSDCECRAGAVIKNNCPQSYAVVNPICKRDGSCICQVSNTVNNGL